MRRFVVLAFVMALVAGLTAVATATVVGVPEHQAGNEWFLEGQHELADIRAEKAQNKKAKNVILFVGDGMGVSTVTAARILEGQIAGRPGEENLLSFEEFPNLALSKVYNVDSQVPDSAGTMTAMMTGVKTDIGVINVDEDVVNGDCSTVAGNELTTWLMSAETNGKSTGVVSTARLTHATPAATYAVVANRNFEDDGDLPDGCEVPDIAAQLIDFPYGDGIEVALGGGRRHFIPNTFEDPEYTGRFGTREDGRNLAEEWASRAGAEWVWDEAGFAAADPASTDKLLGLFEPSHVQYEHDRPGDTGGEPSLTEMTEKAIDILDNNDRGFALVVESGRIDHAHHDTNGYRALTETIEFSNAIRRATEMVDMSNTTIIVTADHSHVFTIAGYPERGNDILGLGGIAVDGLPYSTLSYANGPNQYLEDDGSREDLSTYDTTDPDFLQPALVPMSAGGETHAGEDVAIYAAGPRAHMIGGVVEQSYIAHVVWNALDLRR